MYNGRLCFLNVSHHNDLTEFYLASGLEISEGWETECGAYLSEAVCDINDIATKKSSFSASFGGFDSAFRMELQFDLSAQFNMGFTRGFGSGFSSSSDMRRGSGYGSVGGKSCGSDTGSVDGKICGIELVPDFKKKIKGAYSLSKRYGAVILDYIAIKEDIRSVGIGSFILDRIKKTCKKDGVDKIYLTAKARDFFLKNGARELSVSDALYGQLFRDCATCEQRGRDCFPAVMVIDI